MLTTKVELPSLKVLRTLGQGYMVFRGCMYWIKCVHVILLQQVKAIARISKPSWSSRAAYL